VHRASGFVLALLVPLLPLCRTPASGVPATRTPASAVPSSHSVAVRPHVVIVVFENRGYSAVIGSRRAPYLNSLAKAGALATNETAVTHPSLPNYIAMTSGFTCGYTSDNTSRLCEDDNLFAQVDASGLTWHAWAESIPSTCDPIRSSGLYAKKHVPALMYTAPGCAGRVTAQPPASLPDLLFVSPNMCNDMHDCKVKIGDQWASQNLAPIIASMSGSDVMFITMDEHSGDDSGSGGGKIFTICAGPGCTPGGVDDHVYDHYDLLRTVQDLLGLPCLKASCSGTEMSGLLK